MNKIYLFIGAVIIFLIIALTRAHKEIRTYQDLYNRELQNVEAYSAKYSNLENTNRQFQYTIDELRASKDSINIKLLKAVDQLKIKDKNIKELQYQEASITATDTVIFKDTIFVEKKVPIDTVIQDEWYKLNLSLKYPSTIAVTPSFRSEKYVIINTRKEYNGKPSKCFFIRWFQKKHTVVSVDIIENSPYIENKEQRYINIVK